MRTLLALFVLTIGFTFGAAAQVEIIGGSSVQAMIDNRVIHADTTNISGYRIQLFFGNDRAEAQKTQAKFNQLFPEWSDESYIVYYDPNWRVRVGNFYRKIDAQPMMKTLQAEFGNVFLIRDKITLPALD